VRPFLFPCVFVAALCLCQTAASGEKPVLRLMQTIRLPGVEGRIDHMDFDAASQRLFVCALGNNTLEVIDTLKGERLHSITGLGSPQGVAYIPDSNRIFVANDKGGVCKFYDGETYQIIGELSLGDDADNVRYDAATHQIYAGFGAGGIAIISAPEAKSIGSIKLAAHPEAFALGKQDRRIFVNVPEADQVTVIDRTKAAIIATWKTDGASANFPIALDEANKRLFVGCRLPSKLIVLDTESGEVVSKIGIAADPDDLFYDAKRHRLYAICGAGKIDLIEQADANTYRAFSTIETSSGARTGFFVPEQGALFVAVPHRGSQLAEIRRYQAE
jgi:DNA-binding beta-propeller fold protein YncE